MMPAVTVSDTLVEPRIPEPDPMAVADRMVRTVTTAPQGYEGEGFPVRRAFAGVELRDLDIRAGQVSLLTSPDGGSLVRVIAGEVGGHAGPGSTHTPITLLHVTLQPGAQLRLHWRPDFNALAYVLAGSGTVGAEQRPATMGQLAVFGPGGALTFQASRTADGPSPGMDVLVLGGKPIREPVAAYG